MVPDGNVITASVGPMPKHIWKPVLDEGGAEAINALWGVDADVSEIVCSGPFTVEQYVPNQKVVFRKNPNYYQKDEMGFTIYNVGPQAGETFITFNQNPIEGEEDGGIKPPQLDWLSKQEFREATGTMFTQEAADVGIEINFKPEDFNSLVTKLVSTYDWEMILIGLTGGPDPGTGQNVYPSSGSLHMIEPGQESPRRDWEKKVNEAWDEANLTVDEAQRKSGFEKVQRLWIENVPWVYTCNQATMHAFKNKWANGKTQPISDYTFKRTLHRVFMK